MIQLSLVDVNTKTQILTAAEWVLLTAVALLGFEGITDKRGGYLCVTESNGQPFLLSRFGVVPFEKAEKYYGLSQEKGTRLLLHPEHLTSFESRDSDARVGNEVGNPWGKWGGAVKGKNYNFSFSGFPELLDEASMFALAIRLGEQNQDEILAKISDERNRFLRPLLGMIG